MVIQVRQVKGVTVLTLSGSINTSSAPKVNQFIHAEIARGNVHLVADCKSLDYTDSTGLRVLLAAIKATRSRSGDLRLVAVQPDVLRVLELSGFISLLKLFDDLDSALASYS